MSKIRDIWRSAWAQYTGQPARVDPAPAAPPPKASDDDPKGPNWAALEFNARQREAETIELCERLGLGNLGDFWLPWKQQHLHLTPILQQLVERIEILEEHCGGIGMFAKMRAYRERDPTVEDEKGNKPLVGDG
jgi:hypothetical protein